MAKKKCLSSQNGDKHAKEDNEEEAAAKEEEEGNAMSGFDRASIISRIYCCYMAPFLARYYGKDFDLRAIGSCPLYDRCDTQLDRLQRYWRAELRYRRSPPQNNNNKNDNNDPKYQDTSGAGAKPSLLRAIAKAYGAQFAWQSCKGFSVYGVLRISMSFVLGRIIHYSNLYFEEITNATLISDGDSDSIANRSLALSTASPSESITTSPFFFGIFELSSRQHVTIHCLILCAIMFLNLAISHPYYMCKFRYGMNIRVAVSALVYRKAIRITSRTVQRSTIGQIVNLISTDVNRFDISYIYASYLVLSPLITALCLALMYRYIGWACLGSVAIIVAYLPLQAILAQILSRFRTASIALTDDRLRAMAQILPAMRVIKMYAWERPFARLVHAARRREIGKIRQSMILRSANLALYFVAAKVMSFVCIVAFLLDGGRLNAENVFVTLSLMATIREVMTYFFPNAISYSVEAYISIKRIEKFLLEEEIDDIHPPIKALPWKQQQQQQNDEATGVAPEIAPKNASKIALNHVTIKLEEEGITILNDISFEVLPEKLTVVIGPVGSGKSSVLLAILGELPISDYVDEATRETRSGDIEVSGQIGYVSQEAWIFAGTVRDNILFGREFDPDRYREAVEMAALVDDFRQFDRADQTPVDDRGTSLSGGQRARISLARALYADADCYLLDDPLSAVDAAVANHIFDRCIKSYLRHKCVLLVTHQLQYVKQAAQIVVLRDGQCLARGSYQELLRQGIDMYKYSQHQQQQQQLQPQLSTQSSTPLTDSFGGDNSSLNECDNRIAAALTESSSSSEKNINHIDADFVPLHRTLSRQRSQSSLLDSSLPYRVESFTPDVAVNHVSRTSSFIESESDPADDRISILDYMHQPSKSHKYADADGNTTTTNNNNNNNNNLWILSRSQSNDLDSSASTKTIENCDDKSAGHNAIVKRNHGIESSSSDSSSGSPVNKLKIYWQYVRAGAGIGLFLLFFITNFITQFLYTGCDYWLSAWTDYKEKTHIQETNPGYNFTQNPLIASEERTNIITYSVLIAACFAFSIIRTVSYFVICMRASVNLHNRIFSSLIEAPIVFFDKTPIGVIMNRVSRDLGIVDDLLPPTAFETIEILCSSLGIFILCAALNYFIIAPLIIIFAMIYFVNRFYVNTARKLKRLEGVARSPLFNLLASTLSGLATIRVYAVERMFLRRFAATLDQHTAAFFAFISASRLYGEFLELICVAYIWCLILVMNINLDHYTGAVIGLTISQSLMLTNFFNWGIRQFTEVETFMTSVERIIEFGELSKEELDRSRIADPGPDWPSRGDITFRNVSLSYEQDTNAYNGGGIESNSSSRSENEKDDRKKAKNQQNEKGGCFTVLRDLNFTIYGGEKIGIVGRTGAGKSSLITTLFRLTQPTGTITIDGIDTGDLSLARVRRTLSIIPQEPTLFAGDIRRNLDPFDETSDDELWRAIEKVQLSAKIRSFPAMLDSPVSECGADFSVGQKQLICLARAILRRNRILILDEATANVDPHTDALIQHAIRHQFADCTVITIAHRLNTIIDYDRVMVLDAGRLTQFDAPYRLIKQRSGTFYELFRNLAPDNQEQLKRIAKSAYEHRGKKNHSIITAATPDTGTGTTITENDDNDCDRRNRTRSSSSSSSDQTSSPKSEN